MIRAENESEQVFMSTAQNKFSLKRTADLERSAQQAAHDTI